MHMTPVVSTNVRAIGYEGSDLYVAFNSGGTYRYSGVPVAVYNELMSASSKGKYLHLFIKGRYPYARIA